RALDHEAGLLLTALSRACSARDSASRQTAEELDHLAIHPLVALSPAVRANLLAARVQARLALPQEPGLEGLLSEFEATRRTYPSWSHDLRIYRSIARHHARNGEWSQAEAAYNKALAAAGLLYRGMTDSTDRASFLQGQADLLAEVRTCWQQVG